MKWTDKLLRSSATRYSSIKEWRTQEPSAYATASQRKLLPELTEHMRSSRRYNYWNKERVAKSATKYKTKSEWAKAEPSAYGKAHKLGIMEEVTGHMDIVGNKLKRCLYCITVKGTNLVYIGLTYNFKRRMRDHLKSKRFIKLAGKYGAHAIVQTQITDYIDAEIAQAKEAELIQTYEENEFTMLNRAKAGSLGGVTIKWTEKAIIDDAKNYDTVMKWARTPGSGYPAASAMGILDKATAHMSRKNKAPGSWMKQEVVEIARKFRTITDWVKADRKSYAAAQRLRLLDDPDVVGHFTKGVVINSKWTVDTVLESAKNYDSKSSWKANAPAAYKAARRHNIFHQATAHMLKGTLTRKDGIKTKKALPPKWTKEETLSEARKYSNRAAWKNASSGSYAAAVKNGWLKDIAKHMEVLNPKGKWQSREAVIKSARLCSTRSEWYRKYAGAYDSAVKNGWLDDALSQISGGRRMRGYWSKEKVMESARQYSKLSQWRAAEPSAYSKARKCGWIRQATGHMNANK